MNWTAQELRSDVSRNAEPAVRVIAQDKFRHWHSFWHVLVSHIAGAKQGFMMMDNYNAFLDARMLLESRCQAGHGCRFRLPRLAGTRHAMSNCASFAKVCNKTRPQLFGELAIHRRASSRCSRTIPREQDQTAWLDAQEKTGKPIAIPARSTAPS